MGAFALCVENATRDIHSLLNLHRVHPQVRSDIQRILSSLLRKAYTDAAVHGSGELRDAPEQVCRALVESIVDKTLNVVIPTSDTRSLERCCAKLESEKESLKMQAVLAQRQLADVQEEWKSFKMAHDYTLGSYFREVLVLRGRIDLLQKQNRAQRSYSVVATTGKSTAAPVSIESQLKQFKFLSGNGAATIQNAAAPAAAARSDATVMLADSSGTSAPSASVGSPNNNDPETFSPNSSRATEAFDVTAMALNNEANTRAAAVFPQDAPLTSASDEGKLESAARGKDRTVRIAPLPPSSTSTTSTAASPPSSSAHQRNTMVQTNTTTSEIVTVSEPESVDAVFDYERYLRIRNGLEKWSEQPSRMGVAAVQEMGGQGDGDPEAEMRRRRRRQYIRVFNRTHSESFVHPAAATSDVPTLSLALEREQMKVTGFRWVLHYALEHIQNDFQGKLSAMRRTMLLLQQEHARDVRAIGRALQQVQKHNDALLDFLKTFVQETARTTSALALDARATTITDLLSGGALPAEMTDKVTNFFHTRALFGQGSSSASSAQVPAASSATTAAPSLLPTASPLLTRVPDLNLQDPSVPVSSNSDSQAPKEQGSASPSKASTRTTPSSPSATTVTSSSLTRWRKASPDGVRAFTTATSSISNNDGTRQLSRDSATDTALSDWSAHHITSYAQSVFRELQRVTKELRVTRVQQLYAEEEANGGEGGVHVRFGSGGANRNRRGNTRSRQQCSSGASLTHKPGDAATSSAPASVASCRYFRDAGCSDDGAPRKRSRLAEGWREAAVVGGSGATAADLLKELVGLRTRRACDEKRLRWAQDAIFRLCYPGVAAQRDKKKREGKLKNKTKHQQGSSRSDGAVVSAGHVGLKRSEEDSSALLKSVEDVLRHRAVQHLRVRVEMRLHKASYRIAELQRLLDLHFEEYEMDADGGSEAENPPLSETEAAYAAQRREGAGRVLRVGNQLKTVAELWNSPYLRDGDANQTKAALRDGRAPLLYVPIGLATAVDAGGNPTGGAGACVVFGDTAISAAPFAETESEAVLGEDDGINKGDKCARNTSRRDAADMARTPYQAVMEYCTGVQLGRPMGRHGGPVYLFQDPQSGAIYVGDASGRRALPHAEEGDPSEPTRQGESFADSDTTNAAALNVQSCGDAQRTTLAMTRILFPAPRSQKHRHDLTSQPMLQAPPPTSSPTPPFSAPPAASTSSDGVSSSTQDAQAALQPVYWVPMAIPLSAQEAQIRQGWQASHRHGHTWQDPIFNTTVAPLPLSSSYHHVVPQPREVLQGEGRMRGVGAVHAPFGTSARHGASPERLLRPEDDATAMVRVRALPLQPRSGTASATPTSDPTPAPTAANSCVVNEEDTSDSHPCHNPHNIDETSHGFTGTTSPGMTGSPADTAVVAAADAGNTGTTSAGCTPPASSLAAALALPLNIAEAQRAAAGHTVATAATGVLALAKQQRSARLAGEAGQAALSSSPANASPFSEAIPGIGAANMHVDEVEKFSRFPQLPSSRTARRTAPTAGALPSAASSARLQRQMRAEKYDVSPPPPSSRRTPQSRPASQWNLQDDLSNSER